MFSPSPELRKSKSWMFNSLRLKKSNKNIRAGSRQKESSQQDEMQPLPSIKPPDPGEQEFVLDTDLSEMDGIIDPAMLSNDASSPPSGFTAPESWSVVVEDGKDPVGKAESSLDCGIGGNGASVSQLGPREGAAAHANRTGAKRMAAQQKIQIRIYKADNTYHVLSVSANATVAALTPKLDEKLPAGEEREMHQLYLKEHGRERILAQTERPADIVRRRLEHAGYNETDGQDLLGSAGLSFLLKFVYKSWFLGPAEEDIKFDNFGCVDLTGRSLRTIPVALYQHADSIVSLWLSRNPMIEIPLDFIQSCTTLHELRLSHMAIKQIPRSLRHSTTLTCLDLSCNRIVTLDEAYFDDIPGLTTLHVQNNRLEMLPWSFRRLRQLIALNISNNKFRTFPAGVSQLLNLRDLDISFNMISELPEDIGELKNLERLVIVGNRVSRLPDELSRLGRLDELDCRRNQISDLTVACMLPQIKTLRADHNALHTLVLSVGPCLTEFDASHNEITQLTLVREPVGRSPIALTSLDISNAKLSVLDEYTLSLLTSLRTLKLDNNCFQAIPDSLGDLKWLETLSCAENSLSTLPQNIGKLQKLETLDVHSNSLSELPASLWNCASLSRLNVTSNQLVLWHDPPPSASTISDIPPLAYSLELLYLGQNLFTDEILYPLMILKELRVLNLSFNDIQNMPLNFFRHLTKLEEVYLSGNELTDFPSEDLLKLTRLSTLFLNGNRLQRLPQELGKVKSLMILDIGNNQLKYDINNWEFDWNWNFNKNLRYLNLSGNKRLQIKSDVSTPGQCRSMSTANRESLAGFSELTQLRVLGLMDVTITTTSTNTADIPDENDDRRVRTSFSVASGMSYGIADTLGRNELLNMLDLVHEFGGTKNAVFAMFGRADPPKQFPAPTTSNHLAKYLQENFVRVFISQINSLDPERPEGIPDALRRSFLKLNQEFHGTLISSTRKMSKTSTGTNPVITDPSMVRSGASGIVVYISDKKMYVANVGNALAVVSNGGSAVLRSRKHDPYDCAETARIRAAEGWISPPGLVNNEIDISRSFGFYYLMPIVNACPYIVTYDLTELDEFVIIANRGLWDYVSYQTAVDIAQRTEPMVAAQKLRDLAISCGADGSIMIMVIGVADLFRGAPTVPAPDTQMLELAMLCLRLEMSASGHVFRPYSEWKGSLQGPAEVSLRFQLPPMTKKMTDADLIGGRALPLNLMSSAFAWLSRKSENDNRLDEFRACINIWKTWDTTTCLINFRAVLSITCNFLKSIEEQELPKSLIDDMMQTDLHCICAQVADILADPIARQDFLKAQNDQAQQLLDLLQDLLDYPLLDYRIRLVILKALRKLSVSSGRIPKCFALSDRLQLDGPHPVAAGGFSDVWKGLIRDETVCVKVMRVFQEADVAALLKGFYHEALIWRQLSHPNLLPFFGLYYLEDTKSRLCLISPWMENGDITRYLKNNSVGVNRLTLALDTGLGLAHLHSLKLVHGDLKAINVLVTRSGRAVLADFGLASVADSKVLLSTCSGKRGGTMRWYAPELFDGGRISFASDVYAFSCICYEIFTGDLPFCDLNNDGAVMFQVMQGQRPTRSLSIPDNVWDLMEECWKADPEARPSAKQIVSRLRDPPICAIPTDAASDWDPCYTSKFRSSLEEHTLFLSTGTCCSPN